MNEEIIDKQHYNNMYRVIFLILFSTLLNINNQSNAQTFRNEQGDSEIVAGIIRIKLKSEVINSGSLRVLNSKQDDPLLGNLSIDDMSRKTGIKNIKRVFPFSPKNEAKHRKHGLHLWYELEFDPNMDPKNVVKNYKELKELDVVKPIYVKQNLGSNTSYRELSSEDLENYNHNYKRPFEDSIIYNDPLLADQWHYNNDGRLGDINYDIDLPEAWQITSGNSDILVAIVDEGIDVFHEDLYDNIWRNEVEINGEQGVDDDNNGYVDDFYGYNFAIDGAVTAQSHGTHVAGTVAAVNNNGIGVAGVAGGTGNNDGIKMLSCQVFDNRANGGGNFAAAIVYGADNGAVIAQNSWGYNIENYYEPEVLDAIRYFIEEAGQYEGSPVKGGVVIFSASNFGAELNIYPGAFEEVVGVTAMGAGGFPAPYSTYGKWTDIAAPGGDLYNYGEEGGVLSTLPGNKYGYMEGTSMSCPHVSGVAALIASKFGGPEFTADDLKRILVNSVDRFIFQHDELYGRGYLNAHKALLDNDRIPPNTISDLYAKETFHDEIHLAWTVPSDPDGTDPSNYYLAISDTEITKDNFDNNLIFYFQNNEIYGEEFTIPISGFLKQTEYWFAVKSEDQFENLSEISNIIKVTTTDAPKFSESTQSIEVSLNVTDSSILNVPIQFSNVGEGIIYWASMVANEKYFREASTSTTKLDASELSKINSTSKVQTLTQNGFVDPLKDIGEANIGTARTASTDHWENDVTEYVSGISYALDGPPGTRLGSTNINAGLSFATRFDIPYDYTFNLTHVETALYPIVNDVPILVEIKKGSRDLLEAETVYLEEYYPDTTEVLKYYKIPIYRPQRFENNESFWVVLHFPIEMSYPLVAQFGGADVWDRFLMSRDQGRSYDYSVNFLSRYTVPMMGVYSTGDDGSYVFIDPTNGEIVQQDSQNVNLIIDANNLTNGNHLASLGITTNDVNKPIVNIEVKVNVTGQKPAIDTNQVFEFDGLLNTTKEYELVFENIGLGNLEIFGISSTDPNFISLLTDSIEVAPEGSGIVPFTYTPATLGVISFKAILNTNIGDLPVICTFISETAPGLVAVMADSISLASGTSGSLNLEISNNITGSVLNYDLSRYNSISSTSVRLPSSLDYEILTSDDINGPNKNLWKEISTYGESSKNTELVMTNLDLGMDFPFYDQILNKVNIGNTGRILMYESLEIIPLWIDGQVLKLEEVFIHRFGDRVVMTFDCNVTEYSTGGTHVVGTIDYQVVLFRDGAIEFRYLDVSHLTPEMQYDIRVESMFVDDDLIYSDKDSVSNPINNGMTIRFQPTNDIPLITLADPTEGTIIGGNSENIDLTVGIDQFQVYAGSYTNKLYINSNTVSGLDSLDLVINISGSPLPSMVDSLQFDKTFIGTPEIGYLQVFNQGSKAVEISTVNFDNSLYQLNTSLPITIGANANDFIPITFTPVTENEIIANATITFSNGDVKKAVLIGSGKTYPTFTHTIPAAVSVNLSAGKKNVIPFTIQNTSNNLDLEYVFENQLYGYVDKTVPERALGNNNEDFIEGYGYSWEVSDTTRAIHRWYDISDDYEELFIENGDPKGIKLPFNFPYFGNNYDSIWVSVNGYITVVKPTEDVWSPIDFKKEDGASGMIAPFWALLAPPDNNVGIKMRLEDDRIYLQWDEFQLATNASGLTSFQLEIRADGKIFFHYKDVESWGDLLNYGLESPDEKYVFEDERTWIISWASFGDNSTIAIAPPLVSQLSSGQTDNFNLTVSAEDIYLPGTYMDTLVLHTNSYNQSKIRIPIQINVSGNPQIETTNALNWDEVIYQPNLILREKIELKNIGTDILRVEIIDDLGLDGLNLFDKDGTGIVKNSSGELLRPIEILPWESVWLNVEISVNNFVDVAGKIIVQGNFNMQEIPVSAKLVDSPVFAWDATNQTYELASTEEEIYSFTIENKGPSTLKFKLIPAVIPKGGETGGINIVEEIGNYTKERPTTVDSLTWDSKENKDGVFTPFVVGSKLGFANRFVAPEGGFQLSHVKMYNYLDKIGEFVEIMVYFGGELPQDGQKVYEQKFVVDQKVDEEWIYFELDAPISIPAGQVFYIIESQPVSNKFMGLESSTDINIIQNSFSGVYRSDGQFYWWSNGTQNENWMWKIRALTASGQGQWLELDVINHELSPNENITVNAKIKPSLAGSGEHEAKIIASSNDFNNSSNEVIIKLNVNAAPFLEYYPNIYTDEVIVIETEKTVLNYYFTDPENDKVTMDLLIPEGDNIISFQQIDANLGQVEIKTDFESAGEYTYLVHLTDAVGNVTSDSLFITVVDKNRTPIFNVDYEIIELNLADTATAYVIDTDYLFTDPDGDPLQILFGNYNPEIVDIALGSNFIDIHPLVEGTAAVVFAADDGKENGFVYQIVYVIVINDPDAVQAQENSYGNEAGLSADGDQTLVIYPNPLNDKKATVQFKLEKESYISIEILDVIGNRVNLIQNQLENGVHKYPIDFTGYRAGIYLCRYNVNGNNIQSFKIVVK